MALQAQLQANNLTTVQIDPLTLTGNEDNGSSSTSLTNPVYSDSLNSVLVWVASISDNGPLYDNQGNQINPNLLDPAFDTQYINCKPQPVTPADNEASYRSKGAWAEGDQLRVNIIGSQQSNSDTTVLVNGFADKVNFAYSTPRTPLERDYGIAGT